MTRLRNIIAAGVILLSFVTISNAGTITGSASRVGTITGSRTGTITGSRLGTITGSKAGTITGSSTEFPRTFIDNIPAEFLFRLVGLVLNVG